MLVIGTLIRHASPSGTVTAISGGMHGATTRSYLIASPSFPLVVAPGFLCAGSDAVDLTSIAPPTDKDLRAAASTQKHPATRFIGRVRHTNPRTSADSGRLQPRSDQACRRARSCQGTAWKRRSVRPGRATADLDSFCARRRSKSTVGAEESLRRGQTKERRRSKVDLRDAPWSTRSATKSHAAKKVRISTGVHTDRSQPKPRALLRGGPLRVFRSTVSTVSHQCLHHPRSS